MAMRKGGGSGQRTRFKGCDHVKVEDGCVQASKHSDSYKDKTNEVVYAQRLLHVHTDCGINSLLTAKVPAPERIFLQHTQA
jgi:hypothetical protein